MKREIPKETFQLREPRNKPKCDFCAEKAFRSLFYQNHGVLFYLCERHKKEMEMALTYVS